MLGIARSAHADEFHALRIGEDGNKLTIVERDGATFLAPKIKDQDSFDKPSISNNHRYAGWLALSPNHGASYSQPLYLVVMDSSKHMRQYDGDFGMVFGWCFTKNSSAVIYMYSFPHGITPVGFDMRRLKDGKLLRRYRHKPPKIDEDDRQVIRADAPAWTRCAQASAASE